MTDTANYLAKALVETNATKNAAARSEYAIKRAIESLAAQPEPEPQEPPKPSFIPLLGPVPVLTADDAIVLPGEREASVVARLSQPSTRQLTWKYLTKNDSGKEGQDFKRTEGLLTFRPGETEKTVRVPITRDLDSRSFKLDIAWPQNVPPVAGRTVTIRAGVDRAPHVPATQPDYPPVPKQTGRRLTFDSKFLEPVEHGVVPGSWRSRMRYHRLQTGNGEIGVNAHPATDPGVTPHPVVDGKRVLRAEYLPVKEGHATYPFSAAMMTSENLFSLSYGYVEAVIAVNRAQGTIPAFWLYRQDGSWPPECDVFEFGLGDKPQMMRTDHATQNGTKLMEGVLINHIPDGQPHTYGIDISPDWLVTLVDGVEVHRRPNVFGSVEWMLLFNVAVGGLAPAPANPKPGWTSEMTLHSVKVWA